ncbi:MAG: hypothetical protein Q7T62_00830 [Undibacterium sp.]|nr:hypothetical protein [Undibacterium sp.]
MRLAGQIGWKAAPVLRGGRGSLKINAHCTTLAGISPASTTSNCRIPAKKQKSECALDCQHRHATTQRL